MGHVDIVAYLHLRINATVLRSTFLSHRDHFQDGSYYSHQTLGGSILHWSCLCGTTAKITHCSSLIDSRHLETVQYILQEMRVPVNIRSSLDQSTPLLWAASSTPPTRTKLKVNLASPPLSLCLPMSISSHCCCSDH
jgi:hypothetical protein